MYAPIRQTMVQLAQQRGGSTFPFKDVKYELRRCFPTANQDAGVQTTDEYLFAAEKAGILKMSQKDGEMFIVTLL